MNEIVAHFGGFWKGVLWIFGRGVKACFQRKIHCSTAKLLFQFGTVRCKGPSSVVVIA